MQSESSESIAKRLCDQFQQQTSMTASCSVAAPGRVNVIGEHLDYNDGFVLPMAIDRFVVVSGTSDPSLDTIEFHSAELEDSTSIPVNQKPEPGPPGWQNYVHGVVAGFMERGIEVPGLKAMLTSTVPFGSGLSSSAALEVAVATFLESVTGKTLEPWDKTLLCQKAEHEFANMPCGIMDQFSSVFGRSGSLLQLDCRSQDVKYIPFEDENMTWMVINSHVKHALVDGEYAKRRQQCESACKALGIESLRDSKMSDIDNKKGNMKDVEYRRARHVVTEIARTVEASDAIANCDWNTAGKLMYQSHESLRADYEVSCSELDMLVNIAKRLGQQQGIYGSRMTGGGFGGCTITLLETDAVPSVSEKIYDEYLRHTGVQPAIFCCRPSAGARVI